MLSGRWYRGFRTHLGQPDHYICSNEQKNKSYNCKGGQGWNLGVTLERLEGNVS
uniref:Uncharacterized protein n=1 Tax=Rhizophora mucronata TaxID=61149 RepID=A0A2P2P607_RHIMU